MIRHLFYLVLFLCSFALTACSNHDQTEPKTPAETQSEQTQISNPTEETENQTDTNNSNTENTPSDGSESAPQEDNMKYAIGDVELNSGYRMPVLGLGTWTLSDDEAEDCVYFAIKTGYRLIDTAQYYGNEKGVGKGLKRAIDDGIVKREDVFVTSKIMPGNYSSPDDSIDESAQNLGLDYIDLMLIHQSGSHDEQVYQALAKAVKRGIVRSIGISNYYTSSEFERMKNAADIVPAVVQNENHLYYQNTDLKDYLKQYNTVVESWYPLGGRGHTKEQFQNETIVRIAEKYHKTAPQIILRYQIQSGYIAIPGSSNHDHIAENYDIFDFELTSDEMQEILNLDKGIRYENW